MENILVANRRKMVTNRRNILTHRRNMLANIRRDILANKRSNMLANKRSHMFANRSEYGQIWCWQIEERADLVQVRFAPISNRWFIIELRPHAAD